jgi:hypothetical protein
MLKLLEKENITETDIQQLIILKVEESIHLDFKQSGSLEKKDKKKAEIAKDVSAFANSAGGIIVYGIAEKNHVADSISYVDGNEITKEWIEQVIQTRIQRKIEDLKIIPIRFNNDIEKSVYIIKIPESSLAPHMTSDKRFYKRFNFESVQMEEYEIRNLYNRKEKTKLLIDNITTSMDIEYQNQGEYNEIEYHKLGFQIENIGKAIEKHFKLIITINFSTYTFKYNPLTDSKPNHFLKSNDQRAISFSNSSPIFPGEIMTIGNVDFGIPRSEKQNILKTGKFYLELIYSNGVDIIDIEINEIIKTNT